MTLAVVANTELEDVADETILADLEAVSELPVPVLCWQAPFVPGEK